MAGIALLGAGIFAKEEHLPALQRCNADLKAVYSRSKSSASTLVTEAQKLGYSPEQVELYSDDTSGHTLDDLLQRSDISGVIIVLPILTQPGIVRRCLAAGKHVLCEKPIAGDVKSGKALIADYHKNFAGKGLVFSVAEQFRYMEAHELARKWVVDDGAVGKLTQVHARIWRYLKPGGKYYETPWRKVPEYQGGFILDGGVHHIAMIRYISGQEVVETKSFARQVAEHLPPVDTVNAAVLFSEGATGTISVSFASAKPATELDFIGTDGSLTCTDGPGGTTILKLQDKSGKSKEETVKSHGIDREIQAFLEAMKKGKGEYRAGPEEALNDIAIVESICSGGGKVENI